MAERLLTRVDAPPDTPVRSSEGGIARFRDLDRVRIRADVIGDSGEIVRVGAVGTIVATWARGRSYEVEFAEPVDAIATVETTLLELVEHAAD